MAWPNLPQAIKAGIVAMVKAARSRRYPAPGWIGTARPRRGWCREFEPDPRSPPSWDAVD